MGVQRVAHEHELASGLAERQGVRLVPLPHLDFLGSCSAARDGVIEGHAQRDFEGPL